MIVFWGPITGVVSLEWTLYQRFLAGPLLGLLKVHDSSLTSVGTPEVWGPRIIDMADTAVATCLVTIRQFRISCAEEQFYSDASLEAEDRRALNNSKNLQRTTEGHFRTRRSTPALHGGE
ncbi:hypothetical protein TNCV_4479801 [Trichonephila clavipes]|nr:hypothetical protein TNCV_4479801 [Trichonephila clavipes]